MSEHSLSTVADPGSVSAVMALEGDPCYQSTTNYFDADPAPAMCGATLRSRYTVTGRAEAREPLRTIEKSKLGTNRIVRARGQTTAGDVSPNSDVFATRLPEVVIAPRSDSGDLLF